MRIRPEVPADADAIAELITAAFLQAEHSGGNEARIVEALRKAESLSISLVATEDATILGHIAFSPVAIGGRSDGWFGLAPVAVLPSRQEKGIGSALVKAGLAILRERGSGGCVVLGEPAYYGRFGFAADPGLTLAGVPAGYFQSLPLGEQRRSGPVTYHPAFQVG